MSDDERPNNILTLPRIGSPPPPDLPPAPDLSAPATTDPGDSGGVRISPWDLPPVPHAPTAPDGAAILRSDGVGPAGAPDAGAPRTGALSLAAVLAIALAAFEGMQTWIAEAVPLRAEAARHRREIELLAAKAGADAQRLGAEANAARRKSRVPSSHDYGRSVFGSGSGGRRRGGPLGNGAFGRGTGSGTGVGNRSGPVGRGGSTTPGGTGPGRSNTSPSGRGSGSSAGGSGRTFAGGTRNGGGSGSSTSGSRGSGSWGGGNSGGSSGTGGRRSMSRKFADWWSKGSQGKASAGTGGGSGPARTSGGGTGGTATKGTLRNAVRRAQKGGPTFREAAGDQLKNRWKGRQNTGGTVGGAGGGSGRAAGAAPGPVNNGWQPGGRTTFGQAVYDAFGERWEKRREDWKAHGGPRRKRPDFRKKPGPKPGKDTSPDSGAGRKGPDDGSPGSGGADGSPGWTWARSSAFDTDDGPDVVITVEQAGPARSHGTRWEPTPIAPSRPQLPRTGPPVLPRAPQRPAGSRPGTTRPKEALPMPPAPDRTDTAGAPLAVAMPVPGGMAAQHATEITLSGALGALSKLVSAGMDTYDACVELGRQARRLLAELETMAADLAVNHNVTGRRTLTAHAELMEAVTEMVGVLDRMARGALRAAETAEGEETLMARHYMPTVQATQDAGLYTPSARLHNDN
ncbi:hypothetical protein ACWCYL_43580 [Streptomyces sp. 900105755]